jgi:hypothetical protein
MPITNSPDKANSSDKDNPNAGRQFARPDSGDLKAQEPEGAAVSGDDSLPSDVEPHESDPPPQSSAVKVTETATATPIARKRRNRTVEDIVRDGEDEFEDARRSIGEIAEDTASECISATRSMIRAYPIRSSLVAVCIGIGIGVGIAANTRAPRHFPNWR